MKADVIAQVCEALTRGDLAAANAIARERYPFDPTSSAGRRYNEVQSQRIFWRDGFLDRYTGARLVFPGTLRLLGHLMPEAFPAHPNWKMAASHFVYWELFPTIDHVMPVARGGADEPANWVTTSMVRNSAKANWTLAEMDWTLHPVGELTTWDGLTRWFLDTVERDPALLESPYLRRWAAAARKVLAGD